MQEQALQLEEVERLTCQLDMAEAFNVAYVGSRGRDGQRQYSGWRRDKNRRRRELLNIVRSRQSIWDNLKRKSRFL